MPARVALITAPFMVLGLLLFFPYIFFRYEQDILVLRNDAPAECSEGGRRIMSFFVERGRSSVPEVSQFGYCGAVVTDKGAFKLPDAKDWPNFDQPRAALVERLVPGCRYRIVGLGTGGPRPRTERVRFPVNHQISRIVRELGCD